jgi:hypothetical protein
MALFVVLALSDSDIRIANAVGSVYPNDCLKVGPGQFFVSAKGTAVDVSNALGMTNGSNGLGIVVSVANYYGYAGTNIWEWLKVKGSGV